MKRRAKIDIPDCLISKGEIYEFFEAENGNYEIREWKGNADGTKLTFPEFFMLENFEEIVEKTVEPVSKLGLLTALKVIMKSEPKDCFTCKFWIEKRKMCSLDYCLYGIAKTAKDHIEAGDK